MLKKSRCVCVCVFVTGGSHRNKEAKIPGALGLPSLANQEALLHGEVEDGRKGC